ncbi:ATP-binding cassette domain-containing protein [Kribbella catacumbae]|uniref:ABC transporter ATP-binding protein n=1 Tax=Kribbella catacumbae TaxID=460086 RepID=UPI00038082D2|nr:ATP-binding cassette domain-containing protein [Kribbella catacumbae]
MKMSTASRRSTPLRPDELAHAAVMAAICSAIGVTAATVPFAAPLLTLGTVPMALLTYRHRPRVLGAAAIAGTVVSFLVVGLAGPCVIVISAYVGGLVGLVKRRGGGTRSMLAAAVAGGTVFGLGVAALLAVLSPFRHVIFDLITIYSAATANVLGVVPGLESGADRVRDAAGTMIRYWPISATAMTIVVMTSVNMVAWWAVSRVFARLGSIPDVHQLDQVADDRSVAPVPVTLRDVCFRYPGTDHDAVGPLNLHVVSGEHLAITGANGSGKTTLMLLLSGRQASSGTLERPGAVGLGQCGGTAVVMQHPESQVLGTRVVDDVVWGLPPGVSIDVDQLLAEVGLAGLGERDTAALSGGELQRLTVAAALAREPRLLIADEITSMVDQAGRETLIDMLTGLPKHHDMAVVHITHFNDEACTADRIVNLEGNEDNVDMVISAPVPTGRSASSHHVGNPLLELKGVGHEYGSGTPWASTSLHGIDLVVGEGEGVLIHGLNGSGKSTLAWIMAGLLEPTTGSCLLDGTPVSDQVGAVALSFQAARLQLMRGRVDVEIASASGFDPEDSSRVERALSAVGLDPVLAQRRIDQLSGGQMRRVVLASLLAREPRAIILDEPLAGLDAASSRGLVTLLTELRRDTGLTVIVISHDFLGLEELCPRTLHLQDGSFPTTSSPTGGTR